MSSWLAGAAVLRRLRQFRPGPLLEVREGGAGREGEQLRKAALLAARLDLRILLRVRQVQEYLQHFGDLLHTLLMCSALRDSWHNT